MDERDLSVFRDNRRLLRKRAEDAERILDGQFHEAVALCSASWDNTLTAEEAVAEATALYRAIAGDVPLITPEFGRFCMAFYTALRQVSPNTATITGLLRGNEGDSGESVEPRPADTGRTCYLRNGYTDSAYRIFSSAMGGMSATYSTGYTAACEEVYYGRSSYVILPVYSAVDGRLGTFHRMLTKFDLNIAAVCFVESEEGDTMLYALAQRGLSATSGDLLDISAVLPDGAGIIGLSGVCEVLGLRPLLVNTTPPNYAGSFEKPEINLHLDIRRKDLGALALFLEASHIYYRIDGLYPIIDRVQSLPDRGV